jgi:hypothetical protein
VSAVPSGVAQSFGVKPMDKTWVEFIELGLKIIAVGAGGVAAWFWYCASKVIPTPTWARGDMPFEPVIPERRKTDGLLGCWRRPASPLDSIRLQPCGRPPRCYLALCPSRSGRSQVQIRTLPALPSRSLFVTPNFRNSALPRWSLRLHFHLPPMVGAIPPKPERPLSRPFQNFVRPDPKAREGIGAERCSDRDIRRVATPRQQNPADPRDVVACIECMPLPAEVDLEPCSEITRWKGWRGADVAQISGAVAGRNVQGPAERDRQMCIVAADPAAFLMASDAILVTRACS